MAVENKEQAASLIARVDALIFGLEAALHQPELTNQVAWATLEKLRNDAAMANMLLTSLSESLQSVDELASASANTVIHHSILEVQHAAH